MARVPKKSKYLGMTNRALNGQLMTVIAVYQCPLRLDVQFEDGTIVRNKEASSFNQGCIRNPNLKNTKLIMNQKHIGEENRNVDGIKMTIVEWKDTNHVTVEFETGQRANTKYYRFKNGAVHCPNFVIDASRQQYIGNTNIAKNGMKMTVVDYLDHNHVTVEFEDGVRRECRLNSFKAGTVKHPGYDCQARVLKAQKELIGKEYPTIYGLSIKIVKYAGYKNVIAEFEDGYQVETNTRILNGGKIRHPKISLNRFQDGTYRNYQTRYMGTFNGMTYFACKCPACGFDQILSAREMIQPHVCEEECVV